MRKYQRVNEGFINNINQNYSIESNKKKNKFSTNQKNQINVIKNA